MNILAHSCIVSVLFAVLAFPMNAIEIPDRVQRCLQISNDRQHKQEADSIALRSNVPTSESLPSPDMITASMTKSYCEQILNNFLNALRAQINDRSLFSATNGKPGAMRNFEGQDFGDEDEGANELTENGQLLENSEFMPEIQNTVSGNMQRFEAENNESAGLTLNSLLSPPSSVAPVHVDKNWLKKLKHMKQVLESEQSQNSQNDFQDFTHSVDSAAETTAASEPSSRSESAHMTPSKRTPEGPWINVIRKVVAKRRRQTLSINNALMALTDMLLSHGKEQLQRNRDSLRYHMYLQG